MLSYHARLRGLHCARMSHSNTVQQFQCTDLKACSEGQTLWKLQAWTETNSEAKWPAMRGLLGAVQGSGAAPSCPRDVNEAECGGRMKASPLHSVH